jgi:hypothetical protein
MFLLGVRADNQRILLGVNSLKYRLGDVPFHIDVVLNEY